VFWGRWLPPAANGGAPCGLARVDLQKIERPKQVLWTALLGEEATPLHGGPHMEDDANACSEELAEAAVLHGCRPDSPGRPVLDVPGVATKNRLEVEVVVVVVVGLFVGRGFFVLVVRVVGEVGTHLPFVGAAAFVEDSSGRGRRRNETT